MLWGNKDFVTGNNKPVYANTSNVTSNSTINGTAASDVKYYGIVAGVSPTEQTAVQGKPQQPPHAGWVSLKVGTGPITDISVSGGTGINAAGYLIITDASVTGTGANANISFTTANSENVLQSYSTDPSLNTYGTFTIVSGGDGFTNASAITVTTNGANTELGTFTITLGGRAGRVSSETLVAMGSVTFDDPKDNVWFTGI
jgi:hypothetical protein